MPMIDVYAAAGTFGDAHALAQNLASELMTIEQVPNIPMFRENTAAFVHELPPSGISNVEGDSTYVRIQVLTNAGALDRAKQLAVVSRFSTIAGKRPATLHSQSGRGSCSPRQSRAAGAWPDTQTQTRSSSRPPEPRSPSFNRRAEPKPDGITKPAASSRAGLNLAIHWAFSPPRGSFAAPSRLRMAAISSKPHSAVGRPVQPFSR